MGNIRFFITNVLDFATIAVSSFQSLFPASNIRVQSPSTHWRSTSLGPENVKFTFAVNTPVSYISILGHNFGPSMVVYFESSVDNFVTTAYSVQLTIQDNIFKAIIPQNQRYYRIRWETGVPVVTTPATTYIRVGRVLGYSSYTEYEATQESDFQTIVNVAFSESAYGVSSAIRRNIIKEISWRIVQGESFQTFINSQDSIPFITQKKSFTGEFNESSTNIVYSKILNANKSHFHRDTFVYTLQTKEEK